MGRGLGVEGRLTPGLELDVPYGDVFDGEVEVVDGAHDGGVEAAGEDLGGERVRGPYGRELPARLHETLLDNCSDLAYRLWLLRADRHWDRDGGLPAA